eukprot:s2586_g3.t1
MDGHSVSMAVSYVEFLSSLFGTPLSSAGRARSYSDETPQASYAPCSPVHWAGIAETECGQGHFEHSREDKESAFPSAQTAPRVKITRSTRVLALGRRAGGRGSSHWFPAVFLSVKSFPPLTWVVEDFVQEMPDSVVHAADPATAWLRSYLSYVNDSSGEEVHILSRLYSDVKVKTLFLPATTKSDLQDLSKLEWQKLTTEFKQELGDLKKHILASLHARSFEGEPMTGRTLERSLRFIVQGLQRGKFHELPSLWDADGWFLSLLGSIDHDEDPLPLRDFNNQADVEDARTKSVQFYMELLRDFDVSWKT